MLYTIITDGKNSLFSTSYRPRGTVFKLVGISSKATNVTHKKELWFICFYRKEILTIFTNIVRTKPNRPRGPSCSAGPELSQDTSMSRNSARQCAVPAQVRYKQNPICIAPLPYMSPLHYYHIECPLPRHCRHCAAPHSRPDLPKM